MVCRDIEIFQSSIVWALCCDVCRTLSFQSSPRCGLCVVVCEDLEFLKFPCVCALCWGLWDFKVPLCCDLLKLWYFSKLHCVYTLCCGVWGLWVFEVHMTGCGLHDVACEDFEFSMFPCVWALCCVVWGLWVFTVAICVSLVLWRVKTLSFQSSSVRALCCGMRGLWIFKVPQVWTLCYTVWGLWLFKVHVGPVMWWFQTLSQHWRDWWFFPKKVLIGTFSMWWFV